MRAFVVALALIAVVCGEKLGYNYRPGSLPGPSIGRGYGVGGGHSIGSAGSSTNSGGVLAPPGVGAAPTGGYIEHGYASEASTSGQYGNGAVGSSVPFESGSAGYNKEFFTYSAPEQEFEDHQSSQQIESSLKKNLRVIFIKTPENKDLESAVLNLAKHSIEQETAIYVLNKQTDLTDLTNKFNALSSNKNNKPEVHFVKYRTADDAANAQRLIQEEYDSLQGPSEAHDGGVVPVLNFASKSAAPVAPAPKAPATPDNSYLPASILSRLRV